jgi:hypothetical protein
MEADSTTRIPWLLSFGLTLLFAPGCGGGARFVRTAPDPIPVVVRAPEQIAVWPSDAVASRPVVAVGTIEGESSAEPPLTGDHSLDALFEIKKEAGIRGCDAVVPHPVDKRIWATSNGTPLYRFHQSAVCLVYVPGSAAAAPHP